MDLTRSGGILLHPTSLPGRFGIGDIGPPALHWVDFMAEAGCGLWQMLPLGPTGFGDSPYQCFSAFAGNPYLISPEGLLEDGLLVNGDLDQIPDFSAQRVDFGIMIPWKIELLGRAFEHFKSSRPKKLQAEFERFREMERKWLDDYSLFMALKEVHSGAAWNRWETSLRERKPEIIDKACKELRDVIERHEFWQFIFHRQWEALHEHAHAKGITLIGDAPIFVAHDSSDVWAHQELFYLDDRGRPKVQAGVPPDYFSPTGQLWGNPLYRWRAHKADGYRWWIERLRTMLKLVDLIRLDHFRGFVGYWEVRGSAKTAEKGRWARGPGKDFLRAMRADLGELPLIAEDLGVITPEVVDLRDSFGLPGMKIMQFAFGGNPKDAFLPHHYSRHCVVYTGTHDNDTSAGWYGRVSESERSFYRRYLDRDGSSPSWDLIRACWASVADFSLAPMQDFLEIGNEARMNYPGKPDGNWAWRMQDSDLSPQLGERIRDLNYLYDRLNPKPDGANRLSSE